MKSLLAFPIFASDHPSGISLSQPFLRACETEGKHWRAANRWAQVISTGTRMKKSPSRGLKSISTQEL